jgi:hypothetical protein
MQVRLVYLCRGDAHVVMCLITTMITGVIIMMTNEVIMVTKLSSRGHHRHPVMAVTLYFMQGNAGLAGILMPW